MGWLQFLLTKLNNPFIVKEPILAKMLDMTVRWMDTIKHGWTQGTDVVEDLMSPKLMVTIDAFAKYQYACHC